MKRFTLALCLVAGIALIRPLSGQDVEKMGIPSAKNIRVRKIGLELKGERVTLVTADGREIKGRLMTADFERFLINKTGTEVEVPINEVVSVILSPGRPELILAGVSGLLAAAFGAGVATLAVEEPSRGATIGAGVAGLVLGGWLGYRSFYQEEIIELE